MSPTLLAYSDEQLRHLANMPQLYESWLAVAKAEAALSYGMHWKSVSGRDYLYQVADRAGNAKSLGPRSPDTETILAAYQEQKVNLAQRRNQTAKSLEEACAVYRALRLPMIPTEAARILREADRRGMLGDQLLVVGTNAMPAYFIEAGGIIVDAPGETIDFDMAWSAPPATPPAPGRPVWAMLKAVDSTYTVNTEKTFQARNAGAYEVELLVAPSRAATLSRGDCPSPIPLPEQEWLLNGRPVSHVVVGRDASPARLVVPDPRWFALQKLWMSEQDKRDPLKRIKDAKQGKALLDVVAARMPQYRLDAEFEAGLPEDLLPYFARWKAGATPAAAPGASW